MSLRFLLRKSSGNVIVPNTEGFRRTKVMGLGSCYGRWRQPRTTQMKGILVGKKAFMFAPWHLSPQNPYAGVRSRQGEPEQGGYFSPGVGNFDPAEAWCQSEVL